MKLEKLTKTVNHQIAHQARLMVLALTVVCCASACAQTSLPPSSTPTVKPPEASSSANAPSSNEDRPRNPALTNFMADFSNRQDIIEKRLADLLRLPKVQIKTYGQTVLDGSDQSVVSRVFISIHHLKRVGINVSIDLKPNICLTEERWLNIVNNTLETKKWASEDSDHQIRETPWTETSGGPDWPIGIVLRSRTFTSGIAVSYNYFFRDQPRCISSPGFTFPQILETTK